MIAKLLSAKFHSQTTDQPRAPVKGGYSRCPVGLKSIDFVQISWSLLFIPVQLCFYKSRLPLHPYLLLSIQPCKPSQNFYSPYALRQSGGGHLIFLIYLFIVSVDCSLLLLLNVSNHVVFLQEPTLVSYSLAL